VSQKLKNRHCERWDHLKTGIFHARSNPVAVSKSVHGQILTMSYMLSFSQLSICGAWIASGSDILRTASGAALAMTVD
jgi:hypothetical protein